MSVAVSGSELIYCRDDWMVLKHGNSLLCMYSGGSIETGPERMGV